MKPWQNDIFSLYVEQRGRAGRNVGKYHPKLKGTRQDVRSAGLSVPSRDAPNFIATLLYNLDIFDDAEADSIIRATSSPARGESLMQSLEAHSDEIIKRQDDISNAYEEELTKYVNRAKINRGRGGKGSKGRTERYEAQAAAIEIAKQQKELLKQMKSQGVDAATSIEDAILNSMESTKDETLVSMQIRGLTDADGLIDTIEKLGVDKSDIGVERVSGGVVVDFFISTNSRIGRDFESIPPTEIDDMFSRFSSSGEVVVEVLPPDDIADAISGLKSSLSQPDRKSKGETYDEPEKEDSEVEFDPKTSGEVPTVTSVDDDEDFRPTEDDFDEVGVAYDPSFSREDDYDVDSEDMNYDPMNPYDEDRFEDEEGERECEECDGEGGKEYPYQGEMEWETCRSCKGSGKTNQPSRYGEDRYENEEAKPDYIDIDGDGDKEEPMKKAAKEREEENNEENINEGHKMSPQQANQWMTQQRNERMRSYMKHDERWKGYY